MTFSHRNCHRPEHLTRLYEQFPTDGLAFLLANQFLNRTALAMVGASAVEVADVPGLAGKAVHYARLAKSKPLEAVALWLDAKAINGATQLERKRDRFDEALTASLEAVQLDRRMPRIIVARAYTDAARTYFRSDPKTAAKYLRLAKEGISSDCWFQRDVRLNEGMLALTQHQTAGVPDQIGSALTLPCDGQFWTPLFEVMVSRYQALASAKAGVRHPVAGCDGKAGAEESDIARIL